MVCDGWTEGQTDGRTDGKSNITEVSAPPKNMYHVLKKDSMITHLSDLFDYQSKKYIKGEKSTTQGQKKQNRNRIYKRRNLAIRPLTAHSL